jgi:hypothetical protein
MHECFVAIHSIFLLLHLKDSGLIKPYSSHNFAMPPVLQTTKTSGFVALGYMDITAALRLTFPRSLFKGIFLREFLLENEILNMNKANICLCNSILFKNATPGIQFNSKIHF